MASEWTVFPRLRTRPVFILPPPSPFSMINTLYPTSTILLILQHLYLLTNPSISKTNLVPLKARFSFVVMIISLGPIHALTTSGNLVLLAFYAALFQVLKLVTKQSQGTHSPKKRALNILLPIYRSLRIPGWFLELVKLVLPALFYGVKGKPFLLGRHRQGDEGAVLSKLWWEISLKL